MAEIWNGPVERIDECRVRIPRDYLPGMRADGIIYADERLFENVLRDRAPEQVANVAFLPGICKASLAMPDIHWGYGFPIGGVAATDPEEGGVISPGGVGYDINCGVRLMTTQLDHADVADRMQELVGALFRDIPCGVGVGGSIRFSQSDERKILEQGVPWLIAKGYGRPDDIDRTESGGCLAKADSGAVSDRAIQRGRDQVGTLGAGNHFVEVQVVDEICDPEAAKAYGVHEGQIVVMIHSGSRGLGYEVCDNYLHKLQSAPKKYGIDLPDRQLVCAPVHSPEGQRYFAAMRCAANYAWANRQMLMHLARQTFTHFFKMSESDLGLDLVYDVAHNIAKLERHIVDGKERELCVHRKGATRAFAAGHPEIPEAYRAVGQPVLVPGDMGRYSFLLAAKPGAMSDTFGSVCHGAGRLMSRKAAIKLAAGRSIKKELRDKGIFALARGRSGLEEEQPAAYKDVSNVVDVVERAGLAGKVCRLRPLGVIKG
jgi:tRNA-splicing ligase RtcB (3'-phosphate/5'-hydroxy nucleic acid ligase)